MKFEIFNWAGERKVTEAMQRLSREHRQIAEGDVFAEAARFYELGINVMIMPMSSLNTEATALLALDTRSFGQR